MQAFRSLDIHILSVGTQNRLQTTQLSVEVSYLAEQLLYCDLLRLNLLTGRFVRFRRAFSQRLKIFFVRTRRVLVCFGEPHLCESRFQRSVDERAILATQVLVPLFLSEIFVSIFWLMRPEKFFLTFEKQGLIHIVLFVCVK